ncbi:hypothetical protein Tco_0428884 [Tanacetum coccineum]
MKSSKMRSLPLVLPLIPLGKGVVLGGEVKLSGIGAGGWGVGMESVTGGQCGDTGAVLEECFGGGWGRRRWRGSGDEARGRTMECEWGCELLVSAVAELYRGIGGKGMFNGRGVTDCRGALAQSLRGAEAWDGIYRRLWGRGGIIGSMLGLWAWRLHDVGLRSYRRSVASPEWHMGIAKRLSLEQHTYS